MAPQITVTGNPTGVPNFTPAQGQGRARANFRIMVDGPRQSDGQGGWRNGESTGWDVVAWGPLAEHVARSVNSQTRVTVTGRIEGYTPPAREGEPAPRQRIGIVADDVAVSLQFGTVTFQKTVGQAARPAVGPASTGSPIAVE